MILASVSVLFGLPFYDKYGATGFVASATLTYTSLIVILLLLGKVKLR